MYAVGLGSDKYHDTHARVLVRPTRTIHSDLTRQTPTRHLQTLAGDICFAGNCSAPSFKLQCNATATWVTILTQHDAVQLPKGSSHRTSTAAGSPFKPHTHNVLHLQSSRTHTTNILHLLAVCPHFAVSCAQAPLLLIAPQPCTDNELRLLAHLRQCLPHFADTTAAEASRFKTAHPQCTAHSLLSARAFQYGVCRHHGC